MRERGKRPWGWVPADFRGVGGCPRKRILFDLDCFVGVDEHQHQCNGPVSMEVGGTTLVHIFEKAGNTVLS